MGKIFLNYDEIQSRVVDLMHTQGISKYKLAQIIGVDKSSITRIFNGERGWGLDMLSSISVNFNVPLDYLVFGKATEEVETLKREIEQWKNTAKTFQKSLLELLKEKEYEEERIQS